MKQETAKAVIDRLQGEAGYATGGYVDRLVFSGLDVHEMLNEIEQAIDTDKLSVEKLQEHLLPYKKEMVQKIIDEKMQLVTADEFLKLHKESLTAIRENDKLQEQLNTAKKHIEHVIGTIKHDGHLGTIQTDWILPDLEKALAAIEKGENNEI